MAFPTVKQGRVDQLVTNILLTYKNPEFLADQILPVVPNLKDDSGIIGGLSDAHLRQYKSIRSTYDESAHRMEFKYTQDKNYQIQYHDLEAYLPDRLVKQARAPFVPRRDAAFSLTDALKLEREIALAELMGSTSILTQNTTLAGGDKFSDYANSNPDVVIETARDTIQAATGMEANCAVMSRKVANTLKAHPFFLDLAKRNAGQNVSNINLSQFVELFKAFFELDNVLIGKAIKISSKEGQTTTRTHVWGDDVVLYHAPKTPSLLAPAFGYSFMLEGADKQVDIRRHENDLGDLVRVMWGYDDRILDVASAYLIKSAI